MNEIDIISDLNKAISELSVEGISNVDLYVAGSSSLILRGASFRATMDIDLAKSVGKKIRGILFDYQINDDMALATDPNISDDLEYVKEACDLIIDSNSIRVFLVWAEFVLILKGFHASRSKDIEDVNAMTGRVNSEKLDKSLELIIKSRERYGQIDPYVNELKEVTKKLKGDK